jgi:hypothetical protein
MQCTCQGENHVGCHRNELPVNVEEAKEGLELLDGVRLWKGSDGLGGREADAKAVRQ